MNNVEILDHYTAGEYQLLAELLELAKVCPKLELFCVRTRLYSMSLREFDDLLRNGANSLKVVSLQFYIFQADSLDLGPGTRVSVDLVMRNRWLKQFRNRRFFHGDDEQISLQYMATVRLCVARNCLPAQLRALWESTVDQRIHEQWDATLQSMLTIGEVPRTDFTELWETLAAPSYCNMDPELCSTSVFFECFRRMLFTPEALAAALRED